jgi:hypothetical protein
MKYTYKPAGSPGLNKSLCYPAGSKTPASSKNITDNSYLTGEPLDQIMGEKKDLLSSKIEMLISGIEERKKIKQQNIYQIDKDYCTLNNLIFRMPLYRKYSYGRERINVERMKIDLERQKRMEEVNYFRDIGLLRKELTETIIRYISETNKQNILSRLEE